MKNLKILFLGNSKSPVYLWLKKIGEDIIFASEPISEDFVKKNKFNFLVSYGYRYILKKKILKLFGECAINLHISYLPYNRGSDPNFWSFMDNTKKGVTIHKINEGIDTGNIIVQKEIVFDNIEEQTLSSTYNILQSEIQSLFFENWDLIKRKRISSFPQKESGSFHQKKDMLKYEFLLKKNGWDTKVTTLLINKFCNEN
tara:strand:- start:229 stop:828 length:600 start_codon:yes stop_codon:yes gene_type:complete